MLARLALLAAAAEATFLVSSERDGKLEYKLPLVLATSHVETAAAAAAAPTLGCTTSSFSVPSWFVSNLTFDMSDSSIMFSVVNRATNYTAILGCANATVTPSTPANRYSHCDILTTDGTLTRNATADKSLLALVRVSNRTSANILLSQDWSCNDRNLTRPIKFSAAGNNTVALQCAGGTGTECTAVDGPFLIRGDLVAPVHIHPEYAEGPIGHSKAGCAAAATTPPSWALQSVYYLNQTGDNGATAISSQTLMLQVINHAIGYQAGCTGFLSDDLSSKPVSFACSGQGYDFVGKDRYRIQTQALFEPATFRFTVNQTWYCDDVDAGKPVSITASGSVVMPLNCTSVATGTAAAPGNKTTCLSVSDIIVKADKAATVVPLPPYSITDPLPTPDGCTVSSIVSPAWTLSSFEIDSSADNKTAGSSSSSSSNATADITAVGFDLQFTTGTNEFTYPVSVYQGPAVAGKPQWFQCKFGPDEEPLAPFDCSYTYNATSRQLTLAADWICNDLDRDHPIQFSGTTVTVASKRMSCATARGQTQCLSAETDSWVAPIANVTWRAADKNVLAP
ncbi:hypothetical protein SCUCBS95973_002693 [Sporothrix curviconia]|uniref:Ig-like domain-containing protein n=1 Tax=Sporothrix curviconia TaxID=1260050 RepID=A0ABP0BA11_9PEZI